MKQLVNALYQNIVNQIQPFKSNIVRIEGINNPIIYQCVCEKIQREYGIEEFIAKLTREKYKEFKEANHPEWNQALNYLHKGKNNTYSESYSIGYAEDSFVDFNNAITRWRNESANQISSRTSLILLMGTEAAQDTGGLADTSFVISPKSMIATLSRDYSVWFSDIIRTNDIHEDYKKPIHALYKALFTQISTDIFKLSDFIDGLQELTFDSIQELVSHICETLNVTWGIPSIVDKKAVPKVSILNKGASDGAKIITSAAKFIERSDDIPSKKFLERLQLKFKKYAERHNIDTTASFPEENPVFRDYEEFEKAVTDFMRGIDLDVNRSKLLEVDYSIIHEIVGTSLPKLPKEKIQTYSGSPVEVYSRIFLDVIKGFYSANSAYPTQISIYVDKISLSDCPDDQKEERPDDQKEDSFLHVCNFVGGILHFFNELAIDIDGQLMEFKYSDVNCEDPFDFANYDKVKDKIKSTGKWGNPSKVQFIVTATNDENLYKCEYRWAFSPYSPWLNAFSYLADIFVNPDGASYILPTLVACSNIQEYLDCESEDEFYAHLQKFRGVELFDEHKNKIRECFENSLTGLFDLVCNDFKDFTLTLTQHGFFNAGNKLRALVQSYTNLMKSVHDHYSSFTDDQKENINLLINIFVITSNTAVLSNSDMCDVIVPAYNPVMLEKMDAQQLFLRRGFNELLDNLMSEEYSESVLKSKFANLVQLSSITQATDSIIKKADEYLVCQNMWEYFGVYYGINNSNDILEGTAFGPSMVADDEDASAMLRSTPKSNIIVRNVLDYIRTFPARVDGLKIAFIAPTDMQHIVSAVHSIAKILDNEYFPATINIKLICLNSKKNSAAYLRRWLDSYFSDDRSVKVNTYLYNSTVCSKADVEGMKEVLKNHDLCFTYNILQSTRVQFDLGTDEDIDINYEKFPMTFTPDTIPATHGRKRRVNISQFQFLAAKQHTQASHIAGHPHSLDGTYRIYRTLELTEIQEAIIEVAHGSCKWVVCVDQAIDRHILENSNSKIIGFTTGEGRYGELNVTVSARKDILTDIKQMLRHRITEKFSNWDKDRLQKAVNYCVDELSQYMDGSRILKALNPYDYEIHSFLAYILTLQMLGLTKKDNNYILRALISLDSYKHWFAEDDEVSNDNKRPDFMLIEIPYTPNNVAVGEKLQIKAKIIECKMGYKNESLIARAKLQLEKGLRTMSMNWRPNAEGVMHRYWLNQLYRAIIFSPLNLSDTSSANNEYNIVREKIYGILNGEYMIDWTGDIFAFWLDDNNDTPDEYEIHSTLPSELASQNVLIGSMVCHNCGQMFIQKMLLPAEDRTSAFAYNDIATIETDEEEEETEQEMELITAEGLTIPKTKDVYIPFLIHLADLNEHARQESLLWFKDHFHISERDCRIVYESNGHLKWETVLDFAITELRKAKLLENSSVGNFHITDLGKKTVELLNNDNENLDFFEIIDLASQSNVENVNPVAPDSEDSSLEVDEATLTGVNNLEDIRVLLGKDKRNMPVYWEFGHNKLANRHILITGTSGQGKTYAIQAMILELAEQNISSVVFDYTDGFLPGKLEPEFEKKLEGKITQEVAIVNRIPVNPFRLQQIDIPPFGSVPEKSTTVAGRISDILKHVYSFGDQQAASIYTACKQGIDQYGTGMDFAKLRNLLQETGSAQAKSVLSKMAQFFDMDLFDSAREFNWKDVTQGDGKVTIIQLTGLDRELQTVVTEIMMWDAWYSLTKFGNKNLPFVVVLDEAQNLSFKEKSPAEKILREGRKYGWSAWFATQFLKGALDSGEISNLQQAAERLYFKPTGEEMSYIADQIADNKSETAEWQNVIKGIQKGQCVVQGDRIKQNGQFGAVRPTLINVSSFKERI